jgi:hypothetical protein
VQVVNGVGGWDDAGERVLTPIFYSAFGRAQLAPVDWARDANRILLDVTPDSVLEVSGRTMQPRSLKLAAEPRFGRASR